MKARRIVWKGFVSIGLILLFVLASQPVSATWRIGVIVGSKTDVNPSPGGISCSADTWIIAIPALGVQGNVGDQFAIWDNATWWDNRSAGSSTAYHNFTLSVNYDGSTGSDSSSPTTTGNAYGTDTLNVTFTILRRQRQAHINWSASVEVPGLAGCTASESGYTWVWVAL